MQRWKDSCDEDDTWSSSSYPLPHLVASQESEEEGEEYRHCNTGSDDEEVIVFEDSAKMANRSWETWGEEMNYLEEGFSPNHFLDDTADRRCKVTVVQSSKNDNGEFLTERKTLGWCLDHGCEEVKAGVWAKSWYFKYLHGNDEGQRLWMDTRNRRLVQERGGRALEIESHIMEQATGLKEKANRDFQRGQYNSALRKYEKAEEIMGGQVMGIYLTASQRTELVRILSNQAECYLRLNNSEEALIRATLALQLDGKHVKSILRRSRAILMGGKSNGSNKTPAETVSMALKDLQHIIDAHKEGMEEAKRLLDSFEHLN